MTQNLIARLIEMPTLKKLGNRLRREGISTKNWGVVGPTKSLAKLFEEHQNGESGFVRQNGRTWRLTRRSKALILYEGPNGIEELYEEKCVYVNNGHSEPQMKGVSMSEKRHWIPRAGKVPETPWRALTRGLWEELRLRRRHIKLCVHLRTETRRKKSTRAFPGLPTESIDDIYLIILTDEGRREMRLVEKLRHRITTWAWRLYKVSKR